MQNKGHENSSCSLLIVSFHCGSFVFYFPCLILFLYCLWISMRLFLSFVLSKGVFYLRFAFIIGSVVSFPTLV